MTLVAATGVLIPAFLGQGPVAESAQASVSCRLCRRLTAASPGEKPRVFRPQLHSLLVHPATMTQQLTVPRSNVREKSPVQEKIAMFKQSQSRGCSPGDLGELEYGRPVVGSKTEARGLRAHAHVFKEIVELCDIINSEGNLKFKDEDGVMHVGILFLDLFRIYTIISDKCVGLLLRARKHNFVTFEGETLFQRRDDMVPIFLTKPIAQIREECKASAAGDKGTVAWHTGVTSSHDT